MKKSSLGARKLLSTNTTVDVKIGSFESVERSTAKTAQVMNGTDNDDGDDDSDDGDNDGDDGDDGGNEWYC